MVDHFKGRFGGVCLPRGLGLWLAVALTLTACSSGPDFKSPSAPKGVGEKYGSSGRPIATSSVKGDGTGNAGAAQNVLYGQDLPAQWWTLFHSEVLNQLIKRALEHNPTLASAKASLRRAKENFSAVSGSLESPNVNAQVGATRERAQLISVTPTDFYLYNASVNVSYTLDAFGASRRQVEGMSAVVDYQRFELEAAYQMLVSNVVTTAIKEAALRAQMDATKQVMEAQNKQLEVVEKQFAAGAVTRSVVLAQSTLLAQTKALITPLEKALEQTRNQLAVYVGRLPGESGLPEFQLDSMELPRDLPVSVPSALVRQRPDIRANEALLHQASALVGVATANQYPQINLTGSFGVADIEAGGLGGASATLWNLGAGITAPLFNGGALKAKRRAAEAGYEQAEAQYRWTVLTAFQNVADNLRAIDADAVSLEDQAEVEALARESMELSERQYRLGAVSYMALLDAERAYHQSRISLVSAQSARLMDTAALFVSLGGGWWNRPNDDSTIKEKPGKG